MTEGDRLEPQQGRERESRISFDRILRQIPSAPPIPGQHTLEPPDVLPVANELSEARLSRIEQFRMHERWLKRGAIAFAMGLGLVFGMLPAGPAPLEEAPAGTFSDADLSAEVVPLASRVSEPDRPVPAATMERVLRSEPPEPAPHVVRLAPIELAVAIPATPERADGERRHPEALPVEPRGAPAATARPTPTGAAPEEAELASKPSGPAPDGAEPAPDRDRDEAPIEDDAAELPLAEAPTRAQDLELPPQPEREDVAHAMEQVQEAVRQCAPGYHGSTTQVRVTFVPSGRVTTAVVTGHLAGTPQGSCVARAVREARVPEFRQDSFVVLYPFAL